MRGTIFDFLELASRSPALSAELATLAARFDFEFVEDELGDEDLDRVTGGAGGPSGMAFQDDTDRRSSVVRTLSTILKRESESRTPIIRNLK